MNYKNKLKSIACEPNIIHLFLFPQVLRMITIIGVVLTINKITLKLSVGV